MNEYSISALTEGGLESRVRPITVNARWLNNGDARFEATYYADEANTAQRVLHECGLEVLRFDDPQITSAVFNLPRFKRIYTDDHSKGWPYLSASEAQMFRPESERWIARDKAPKQALRHFVKEGWLLVTCSGAVGRCVIVPKRLESYFLTHDLVRVVPKVVCWIFIRVLIFLDWSIVIAERAIWHDGHASRKGALGTTSHSYGITR